MEKSDFDSAKDYWIFHINNFEKTGGKAVDYCKTFNINKKSFSAQKSMLKKWNSTRFSSKMSSNFISLNNSETVKSIKSETITLNILGTEVIFNQEPEPKWLAQVLLELRRYSYV